MATANKLIKNTPMLGAGRSACMLSISETFTGEENPLSTPWAGSVEDAFKSGGLAQVDVDGTDERGLPHYETMVCHANQKCTLAITTFAGQSQMRAAGRLLTPPLRDLVDEWWAARFTTNTDPVRAKVDLIKVVGGVGSVEADSGFDAGYLTPGQIEFKAIGNVITATTDDVSVNTTDSDSATGKYVGFDIGANAGIAVGAIESTSFDYVEAT